MNFKQIVDKYISDVQTENIITCKWVKLAVDRHMKDLEREDIYFDEDAANRFLKFSSVCKYTKGELAKQGKRIEFTPQQVFRYWCLFGWKRSNGTRRYRRVYFEVARKNGKSEEAAVVSLYLTLFDKEEGAEVYTAATTMGQARIVHDAAMVMARKLKNDSPKYDSKINLTGGGRTAGNISMVETNSKCEPLPANDDKLDGLNPHGGIIDEYHAHKTNDLLEVIQTGMGSREQPMLFIITTAGFEKQYPCYSEERKLALEVLQGIKKDDSLFTVIYTLDEGDDWKDPKLWVKANPNIGITPTLEYMQEQCEQAINKGVSKEVQFKTKNLNIWTDSSMAWISDDIWMKCDGELPDLKGRECYAGLDLASVSDMNAFVLLFPPQNEGEKMYVLPYFWIPKNTIERKNEIGNYKQWQRDGFIREAGEDVVNQQVIIRDILEIAKDYNIKSFAFDRFLAYNGVIQELLSNDLSGYEFGQGYRSMSQPTKELEGLVLGAKLNHGGNPVMRWQCGNIEISIDPADNIKMDKGKSREKIDGMVALVMALGCWKAFDDGETTSVYDERGIRSL
jgi:phage terminase large subunit-like protein